MGQDFDLDFCIHPRWTWVMIVHQCCSLISFSLLCSWSKERKILPVQNMGDEGGGGRVTSFTDNIFLHFNRNTVWQRRGLYSLWECGYLGLVTVWNLCIFGLPIWQPLLLLQTSSFPMYRLSLGNFSEGIISVCSCFILFRTAGGSHQSMNPTLNGKDVQMMQWERRKIIDLVVGRSNKNNNTKIQQES